MGLSVLAHAAAIGFGPLELAGPDPAIIIRGEFFLLGIASIADRKPVFNEIRADILPVHAADDEQTFVAIDLVAGAGNRAARKPAPQRSSRQPASAPSAEVAAIPPVYQINVKAADVSALWRP